VFWPAGILTVALLAYFSGGAPAATAIGAWVAMARHFAQTDAERRQRITESYAKAADQLTSKEAVVQLGGIFTLERISKESPEDHLTIMETLTAFIREKAKWETIDPVSEGIDQHCESGRAGYPAQSARTVPIGIAAAMKVIGRRSEESRAQEREKGWRLDLREVDLRGITLVGAHLDGAILAGAHLEGANLEGAHLEGSNLAKSHLTRGIFLKAHLDGAILNDAYIEHADFERARMKNCKVMHAHADDAIFRDAKLQEAVFTSTDLNRATLYGANLKAARFDLTTLKRTNFAGACTLGTVFDDADLSDADIDEDQVAKAHGNGSTKLREGWTRPSHWSKLPPQDD